MDSYHESFTRRFVTDARFRLRVRDMPDDQIPLHYHIKVEWFRRNRQQLSTLSGLVRSRGKARVMRRFAGLIRSIGEKDSALLFEVLLDGICVPMGEGWANFEAECFRSLQTAVRGMPLAVRQALLKDWAQMLVERSLSDFQGEPTPSKIEWVKSGIVVVAGDQLAVWQQPGDYLPQTAGVRVYDVYYPCRDRRTVRHLEVATDSLLQLLGGKSV